MWAACGLKVTCVKATYSQTPLGALEFRQEALSSWDFRNSPIILKLAISKADFKANKWFIALPPLPISI